MGTPAGARRSDEVALWMRLEAKLPDAEDESCASKSRFSCIKEGHLPLEGCESRVEG